MSDIVAKIIVKVYLVDGREMMHAYECPKSEKETNQLLANLVEQTELLIRDKIGYLYFSNPSITYNPNNVSGIELTTIGVKALEEIVRKQQSKIGLV